MANEILRPEEENLIDLKHIHKEFDGVSVLHDIDLSIKKK